MTAPSGRTTCFLALLLAASCSTTRPTDLAGFGRTAATLQAETGAAFADANRLTRAVETDRFVRSGAIALTERQFPPAVPPAVAARWRAALGDLARYGGLLATLTDGDRGARQTDAFRAFGAELSSGAAEVDIDPTVAAGFGALAGALVDLRAQATARDILRRTDPDVRRLLTAMADALGRNDAEGLRGTVAANWSAALGSYQQAYAAAATDKSEPRQRQIVGDYLAAIDRRDAQLTGLADLRTSLLALADAHSAAAAGSRRPFDAVLDGARRRAEGAKSTYEAIEKAEAAR